MSATSRHKIRLSMKKREALCGLFFVSLFIIGLVLLYIPAIVNSIRYSISDMDADFNLTYIGLKNFNTVLFVDPQYVRDMLSSLGSTLVTTTIIIIYSLFVSSLLNKNIVGKSIFRALLFLPVITAAGVVGIAQNFDAVAQLGGSIADNGENAIAGGLFNSFSIEKYIVALNISPQFSNTITGVINNIYEIITRSGVQLVIFLAGLQTISPAIYEAAYVEGSSAWESFWIITLPMISPLIVVNVVYTIIDSFTNPGNVIMNKIMFNIVDTINYGIATSMAWIYFLIIGIIISIIVFVLSKVTFYENT